MAIKQVFKSRVISCKYIFGKDGPSKGKHAAFVNFMYLTDVPEEIAELESEIKANGPGFIIYRDPNMTEIDDAASFMDNLKAKIIAEYEAGKEAALQAGKNQSHSVTGGGNPLSSNFTNNNITGDVGDKTPPIPQVGAQGETGAALAALKNKVGEVKTNIPQAAAQSNSK